MWVPMEKNADGGVFQHCSLFKKLVDYSLLSEGGFLVADDTFPLQQYILKPYSWSSMTVEESMKKAMAIEAV